MLVHNCVCALVVTQEGGGERRGICSIHEFTKISLVPLNLTVLFDGSEILSANRGGKKDRGCQLQEIIEGDWSAKNPKHSGGKLSFTQKNNLT